MEAYAAHTGLFEPARKTAKCKGEIFLKRETADKLSFFLKLANLQASSLAVLACLPFLVAIFEGITVAIMLPLFQAVVEQNLGTFQKTPFYITLSHRLPWVSELSYSASIAWLIGLVFGAMVMKLVLQYLSALQVSVTVRRLSNRLRQTIYSRYLSFGKLFFDQSSQGSLNNILVESTQRIAGALGDFQQSLVLFFTLFVYLFLMFFISWKLTLLVILILPVLNFSMKWLIEKIRKNSQYYWTVLDTMNRKVFDTLSCILLVKSYTNEDKEKLAFKRLSDEVERVEFGMDKKQSLIFPVQEIVLLAMILFLVGIMGYLLKTGSKTTLPSFMIFFYILKKSSNSFTSLNKMKSSLAGVSGQMDMIMRVMSNEGKFLDKQGAIEFRSLEKNIEIRNLSFSYGKGVPALKNVSCLFEKGRMTAVVGASGSGKTTLIHLLMRFYDAPPKSILIDDVDINQFTLRSLRSKMSLVSQDTWLFHDSLRSNLLYGLDDPVSEERLNQVLQQAELYDLVMRLPERLETKIGDRGVKLSGGEKQRLSIARTLLKGSEILILDEATSALDSQTEQVIQRSIDKLIQNKTSIVIAHRLSTIQRANKILVIENGQLVEQGTLQELLDMKNKFWAYWQAQKFL